MKLSAMILGLLLPVSNATAQTGSNWPFPDDDLEARIAAVSDGELTLLDTAPELPDHHHRNLIQITETSLHDGWVIMQQCHMNLLSKKNIDQVRVEGSTVQLKGIAANAQLCLRAESRALIPLASGYYQLKNGPFMRRFLDGYYPRRVSLEILYPSERIKLQSSRPLPGKAGSLQQTAGRIVWDSWFKGRLFTEFEFQRVAP